ncbi:MAG: CHAT domain-containing tetratricopeptide repeat protein [Bacteroidota bacterium]
MMPKRIYKFWLLFLFLVLFCPSAVDASLFWSRAQNGPIDSVTSRIGSLFLAKDFNALKNLSDSLKNSLATTRPGSASLSEIYYNIGVSLLLCDKYNEALDWLTLCVEVKEKLGITDNHYANAVFNIGVAYNYLGDLSRVTDYMFHYIKVAERMYGEFSPEVAGAYSTLAGASLEQSDYNSHREYNAKTLEILNDNKEALKGSELSRFYINMGVGYSRLADYAKARIYLEKAEAIYNKENLERDNNYINLINSLALAYGNLGLTSREEDYYERGMELAVRSNSFLAFNLIYNFANEMGRSGQIARGEEMISDLVERSGRVYGQDSRFCIEALHIYAEYMAEYKHDYKNSVRLFLPCLDYIERHAEETALREPVLSGYAFSLSKDGQHEEALKVIQNLIFYGYDTKEPRGKYENPEPEELRTDRRMVRVLRIKREILKQIYSESGSQEVLENAAITSELIISLIDKIRISISEDESRIVLGSSYRDSYLLAISDFELCYRNTGETRFLEKVFEFAEKSKVAGLLSATRELNAVNFHIPAGIAELEKSLQRDIAFYNSRISGENEKTDPDRNLIAEWNNRLFERIRARDSLVMTFERDYPGYYTLKYAADVLSIKDVPHIAGRNANYLNYVVSDSLLYIMLVNRKYEHLETVRVDSTLSGKLREFRSLLSGTEMSVNARSKFEAFSTTGYELYRILIEPVQEYFISDELLISPDNILSYLPFETFLSSPYQGERIVYRMLPYLMNDFSISYTYSASFMNEIVAREFKKTRKLTAFAPMYTTAIDLDSLSAVRDANRQILFDLPYARIEAEYVSGISNGTLFLNEAAKESVFKAEAEKYDIIHLAMHTWLNDQNPMASAMIFAQGHDQPEDGFLNTYEVYGIPLKARMVVLSSCNTGSGILSSGEGILSLARGFMYSGSQSVVMSMWEIEDKSGTEIVKMFYDELQKGMSKSRALKKARTEYLRDASQLKSHPYFWASLVVYGDNSPVYPGILMTIIILSLAGIFLIVTYFMYRRYS